MKILILRFSSIGDIVLTTPLIRCLKKQHPEYEIHYATKDAYKSILTTNPYLSKVHTLKNDLNDLVKELSVEKFDFVIDLHHNIRTQILKMRLRVKSEAVNKLNFEKWLLTQFKIDKLPKYNHIVDRYLYTVRSFGVINDNEGLDYFTPPEDQVNIKARYPELTDEFIAIAIGAKYLTKRLPYAKIVDICNQLELPIVLLGGLDDLARGEEIIHKSTNGKIVNACGKLNLNQSASMVSQAKIVVTHDTGLMHIAAAFRKDIVSIWGNTVPELGMYPYMPGKEFRVIQVEGLECRPCSKIGYKKCPKGHFDCMQKIDTKQVLNEIDYYLKPVL